MVGIIQEQHAERARLFMQWKGMGWPILVDAHNRLGVSVVPITLLIDAQGIVRHIAPPASRAGDLLERFLAEPTATESTPPPSPVGSTDIEGLERAAKRANTGVAWRDYADALALWGGDARIDEAIDNYQRALGAVPDDGPAEFRLGVSYRRRYDSARGEPADFARAVEHWTRALDIDPNNYIWRRRIQQYGPRLDKPYPFYDWVDRARDEIEARGEAPVVLNVEPRGAEVAHPSRTFEVADAPAEPDPEGRILRDEGKYVRVDATVVPHAIRPQGAARVHLEFRTRPVARAHWNNEASGLLVWVEPPAGWQVESRRFAVANPAAAVSTEPRHVEFEVHSPERVEGRVKLPAYALYYVCEGVDGACLYRRQDLSLDLIVADDKTAR
jgi:hypothetical protein